MDLKKIFSTAAAAIRAAGSAARLLSAAAVVCFAAWSATSFAQPRPDAGSVLEGVKKPATAPTPGREVLPPRPEPKPALGAPGLKLVVKGFRISGNTIYAEPVLLATVKEFVGKEQNIDGLNDAATKVRAYYRERGYFLAQAYLPQQEIKDGVVEIAVIEARVGKVAVNIRSGTRYSERIVRGIVEQHLKEGAIITEVGLETPLLLLNDFPNATVTSEIRPSQTIGAADLTVNVGSAPGWIGGSVDIDNSGNRFTGAIRTGISLNVNNPLALGDQINYRAFRTDDEMGFYRLAYTVPVAYWGTRVGASYASFHYRLGKDFLYQASDTQRIHGAGGVWTLYAFHPFIRTRSSNLIFQYAYETKLLNDRDELLGSITDRKITANKVGFVGDFRDGFFGGGLNSYGYTYTGGEVFLSPQTAVTEDQGISGPKTMGRFSKHNMEFRRLQKITDNTSLLLAFTGQYASTNLQSAEKFSLGGAAGVRSYPSGEALGDAGYVFQGEFRYLVPGFRLFDGDVSLSGFYDQGWVRIQEHFIPPVAGVTAANANHRRLNGIGVGASLGKDSDFVIRASAAWRLEDEAAQSDTAKRVPRVWVQAIKWF